MASGVQPSADISGAQYVQQSLSASLGAFGPVFITVAMILFAFTTLIGNLYYVDQCIVHLIKREPPKALKVVLYVFWSLVILLGAGLSADLLWGIADVTMGAMTIINIPVIFLLHTDAVKVLRDFDAQRKAGKDPVFRADSVKLKGETECWK
jgi:AGCS family alanine or glycine:cation symporter